MYYITIRNCSNTTRAAALFPSGTIFPIKNDLESEPLTRFSDDHIRRLLEEQNRIQNMVDQATGGPAMRAIIEASDRVGELRRLFPSAFRFEAELSSSMRAVLDAASGVDI